MPLSQLMQDVLARQGHFGWVPPRMRTNAQHDAHARAVASSRYHRSLAAAGLPFKAPPKGAKVVLTDAWKAPGVVKDVGFEFTGFRQLTGSCVGVSTGDAVFTLGAIQRLLTQGATKAFLPWWCYDYGTCRKNEGDSGPGEGAVDSVMFQTIMQNGTMPYDQAQGVPQFDRSDGLAITSSQEMQFSDGAASCNTQFAGVAKKFPVGSAAVCNSTSDMATAICNGYPVLDGCDDYIGNGSLSGDVALGRYDGQGGHSTCYLGYWDHPSLGPLFLYSNQWDGNTYPQDASGKGRCCVWVKEADAARLFSLGGSGGETAALSHLTYFPAQPDVPVVLDPDKWQ